MTTYIEQVITEVSIESESPEDKRAVDRRWSKERDYAAWQNNKARTEERLKSEGFDD